MSSSSGRTLRIWLVVLLIASVFAVLRRPFDQLGYDLGVAVALAMGIILPHVAATRAADYRRSGEARRSGPLGFVLGFFAQMVVAALALLLVPIAAVLVRGLFTGHCDLGEGFLWYVALPGVSALYAIAVGIFFGLMFRNVVLSTSVAYVFLLGSFALAVRHVIADPPVFFFDHILGYVPGPIYDERVTFTRSLVWARLGTLAWVGLLLGLAAATVNTRRTQLEPIQFLAIDFSLENVLPRAGVLMSAVLIIGLHVSRQETGVAPTASSIQKTLGGRVESENFIIYYGADQADSTDVALMVQDHEYRLAQILATLELPSRPLDEKIESYVYPDPDTKKRLMGARGTSFADPFAKAMHLNASGFPHPVLKHELTHIVSSAYSGWPGFNLRIGIHEGFAVAVDWEQERLTPHEWSAIMRAEQLLPEISRVTAMTDFWREPAARAYLATGSFLRHLIDERGPAAMLAFFGDGDYERHFGKPLEMLEADWLRALDEIHVSPEARDLALSRLRRGAIFDRQCPRRVAELADEARTAYAAGHYEAALESYDRILSFAPDDDGARVGKLRALVALKRGREAEAFGRSILGTDAKGPTGAVVHDLLGDAAWRTGDRARAREHYEAVLATGAPEHLRRAAEAKLAVIDENAYVSILTGDGGPTEDVATLANLTVFGPERNLASYLLGRRLYAEGTWVAAEARLREAAGSLLPSDALKAEALRLLGDVRYRLGNDEAADAAFTELAGMSRWPAEVITARAWVDRTRWRRSLPFATWEPAEPEETQDTGDEAPSDEQAAAVTIAEAESSAGNTPETSRPGSPAATASTAGAEHVDQPATSDPSDTTP